MTSVAEAMNLGVKLGINPKVLMGCVRCVLFSIGCRAARLTVCCVLLIVVAAS